MKSKDTPSVLTLELMQEVYRRLKEGEKKKIYTPSEIDELIRNQEMPVSNNNKKGNKRSREE